MENGLTRVRAQVHCVPSPRAHSQCLHVGVLCHIPHLHGAVMGRAVELVGASTECQPLRVHGKRTRADLARRRDRSGPGRMS